MKILVIGSAGREHAICRSLQRHAQDGRQVFCAPASDRIAQTATRVLVQPTDVRALADFAAENRIDLTIVGGEAALAAGITDEFARRHLTIAAPTQRAAQLETSKVFAKEFMQRQGIPTARFRVADTFEEATQILRSRELAATDGGCVIKADGLAAGKGVIVATSETEAERAVADLLGNRATAGRILIEEKLEGREVSVLLWTDGRDYRLMPVARDHKRIGERDTGANTGGMGAITNDDHLLDLETLQRIEREIIQPTIEGARREGFEFRGVLYVGLMLTADGVRVLEYNARFGDPEAQAILVRLETDLAEIFHAVAHSTLGASKISWSKDASACVVLAARGYPQHAETGAEIKGIEGLDKISNNDNVQIFHAGTTLDDAGAWRVAGGRVLNVTATGETLDAALDSCYETVGKISWDGMQYRRDIGK